MTKRALLALVPCLGAAACTDLPDVASEGCGNLILNVDEDCDGFSQFGEGTACGAPDTDNACAYVHDAAERITCPTGWGAGVDGRCRRPSGFFDEFSGLRGPFTFAVDDFRIVDVDGDGLDDVAGGSGTQISVRFGAPGADLGAQLTIQTRIPTGAIDYGLIRTSRDIDDQPIPGTAGVDVVVPVSAGIFALMSPGDRRLDPFAYASLDVDTDQRVYITALEAVADIDSEIVALAGRSMAFIGSTAAPVELPDGFVATKLLGTTIPTAKLDTGRVGGPSPRAQLALAFDGATQIYLYTSVGRDPRFGVGSTLALAPHQIVALPAGVTLSSQLSAPIFGHWDDDACFDLIIPATITGLRKVAVALGGRDVGGCTGLVAATAVEVATFGLDEDGQIVLASQRAISVLATGDFDGDGIDDVVTDRGIALRRCLPADFFKCGFALTSFAAEPWIFALVTDLNHDNHGDVAAISEGAARVDVMVGTGIGIFNRYVVDTERPVTVITTGDFDGDVFLDLAVVESGLGAGGNRVVDDSISVVFGAPAGGPTAPVFMGTLGAIEAITPVSQFTDAESIDLITDLAVVATRASGRGAAILQGSTARRLLSPYILQYDGVTTVPDVPLAALIGDFVGDASGPGASPDVIAIGTPGSAIEANDVEPPCGASSSDEVARLWIARGAGDGNLAVNEAPTCLPLYIDTSERPGFNSRSASWVVGDLDGDRIDEIVGIDDDFRFSGGPLSADPDLVVVRMGAPPTAEVVDLGSHLDAGNNTPADYYNSVRTLRLADLDGDADLDLLALFEGEPEGGDVAPAIVVFWNEAGAFAHERTTLLRDPGLGQLYAALPVQIDDGTLPEILVFGSEGAFSFKLSTDTTFGAATRRASNPGSTGPVEVGDLDGDGLDDLAYTVGSDLLVVLQAAEIPLGASSAPTMPEPALRLGGQP